MLLASPDDSVDPVKYDEPYDEQVYHKFAREEGWTAPRQWVIKRVPLPQEWVVIGACTAMIDGVQMDMMGAEGRVIRVDEEAQTADVALGGNSGYAGSDQGAQIQSFNLRDVMVMITPSLKKGDKIKMIRGAYKGIEGIILRVHESGGRVDVSLSVGEPKAISLSAVLVEHVEKVVIGAEYFRVHAAS